MNSSAISSWTSNALAYTLSPFQRTALGIGSATALVGLLAYRWSKQEEGVAPQLELAASTQEKIKKTYAYVMGGLGLTALTAAASHLGGLSIYMLQAGPILSIASLGVSIGALIATMFIPKEKQTAKHLAWSAFNVSLGISISPLCFINKTLLAQAGLITLGAGGAFSLMAALAKSEKFLTWEGPLMAALGASAITTTAAFFFPGTAFAAAAYTASTYGGLAIFCGLLAIDTRKMMVDARDKGDRFDPINASIGIYLDIMNIFVRVLKILIEQKNKEA